MKTIVLAIGLLSSGLVLAQTLETPHYKIVIRCLSPEHTVGCDRASYEGTNKETGSTIHLVGKQRMEMCPDGQTPCHSLGYEFSSGNLTYFVSENGQLQVMSGAKVLVEESGTWTY